MSDKSDELIDISICIGNSCDWEIIIPGKTYNFRVFRNNTIGELKSIFCDCFDENIRNILEGYEIYTKKIIRLYDNDLVKVAFSNPNGSIKDIIDNDENIFYALAL
tara:strand:+ start:139 stop:456 length:318 start_codon:yes stop_codon:yes gene_type:complete